MDKLAALNTFRRVVECGSFRAAARELGRSNAAVSKQLADLEAVLGAALITRTTRRLALTEVGRAYYERCVRILDDLADAEAAVTSLQVSPRGELRVNAPMSFGLLHLAPALPDFMRRYPDVCVNLVMNDRAVDLLEEGFDVGIRVRTSLADSSLISRRLAPVHRMVCAAPDYLDRHGTPERPEQLAGHRCLIYSLSESPSEWMFTQPAGGPSITVSVPPCFVANSSIALREAILAGSGIALMPDFVVAADVAEGRLKRLLSDFEIPSHTIYALYPATRHLSPKVRSFVEFLVERYAARTGRERPWEEPGSQAISFGDQVSTPHSRPSSWRRP